MNRWAGWMAAGLALSVVVVGGTVGGCDKKEEKVVVVTPPPPPPPKEPDPVDLKGLAQTLKADKRLVFSDGATTTKESLAKAVVGLGDALARGDDKKFGAMIDPMSRELLMKAVAKGDWKETTSKVTQVRLVRLTPGADPAYSPAADPLAGGFTADQKKMAAEMMLRTMSAEGKAALKEQLGHEPTADDFDALMEMAIELYEKMKADGPLPPEMEALSASMESAFRMYKESKDAKPVAAPKGEEIEGAFSLTFAMQLPGEAHAMAWVAVPMPNDKWTFKASGALQPPAQKRASDFDGIVGSGSGAAVPSEEKKPDEAKPEESKPVGESEGEGSTPRKGG